MRIIKNNCQFKFLKVDLQGREAINDIFIAFKPKVVINLAAQAGVRYSLENPAAYINSNIVGFSNLIEQSKIHNVSNFIYASSSS